MPLPLAINGAVRDALERGGPVVALESTVIAHGLPEPANVETALACEEAVRAAGATPATIAILGGEVIVGCTEAQIRRISESKSIAKVSRRDIASVLARDADGATTVAGTILCAHAAGIRVMATGGIGGVHRGGEESMDVSADLDELGRTPVAVVCAGAKSILDLPRTLEVLETKGVPVAGFLTDRFPAFFSRDSGLPVNTRVDTPEAAARMIAIHDELPNTGGLVIANPVPEDAALDEASVASWTSEALAEASSRGVSGRDVTPFLLARIAALSGGATIGANVALLKSNAKLAARIACAMVGR